LIATYIQKSNYEITQLDDELLILDMDLYTITKLNAVGGACWALLGKVQTVESLVLAIQERYRLSNEQIKSDIEFFLNDLLQCGLIQQEHG